MTDTEIKIKVTADSSQAASEMKKLHRLTTSVGGKALQQQQTQAVLQKKQQQAQPKNSRVQNQQIQKLQQQNKLIQQQNKLIQQNIRLAQQQNAKAAVQTSLGRRLAQSMGLLNQHGSPWTHGRSPRGGGPGGGGPGGPGRGRAPRGGGGPGVGTWIMGGVAGMAAAAIGALVSTVVSQIAPSDAAFTNFAKAQRSMRALGGASSMLDVAHRGRQFGFTALEGIQQMRGVARATGSFEDLTTAQATARGMGMDVGEVTEFMGMLTRSGQGGKGAKGEKALYRLMQGAISSGLDKSRAGEHLQAVSGLVQQASARTAGTVDAAGIGGLLAFFSKSGQAGLQGARGANVLSQIDNVVTQAGFGASGDPVQALIMRAMGFGTGGNADYYTARGRAQQGIFGEGGAANLRAVFKQFDAEYGTGQAGNIAISEAFKLSQNVVEQIREVISRGGSDMDAEIARLTQAERPVEDQILDVLDNNIDSRLETIIDTERQQIGQGSKISRSLDGITNAVNSIVRDNWPILVELLKVIADAVQIVAKFITNAFRGTTAADSASLKIASAEEALKKARETGDEATIMNALQDYQFQMNRIREELLFAKQNPGVGTHILDSISPDDGFQRNLGIEQALIRTRTGTEQAASEYRDRRHPEYAASRDSTRETLGIGTTTTTPIVRADVTVVLPPGGDVQASRHRPATTQPAHR